MISAFLRGDESCFVLVTDLATEPWVIVMHRRSLAFLHSMPLPIHDVPSPNIPCVIERKACMYSHKFALMNSSTLRWIL